MTTYVSTVEQMSEHETILSRVSDLLDIELSREARKELSYIPVHNRHYYRSTLRPEAVVNFSTENGLMVIGLDGYGKEIYYTRHASGKDVVIDVFAKFVPYQPKHIVVIKNTKGMGPTDIYSITRI
jgi:hypothetical protein